jgi:maleate cis-trans isomerase
MYGWRARIGAMIPTNNTVIEPEFMCLAPKGVTFHVTRMVSSRTGRGSVEGLLNLVKNVDRAAEELAITGVQAVLYGCLSTSFAVTDWEEQFPQKVAAWSEAPAITAFAATCEALRSQKISRVAVLCPYGPELQQKAFPAFSRAGFTVTTLTSLNVVGLQAVCDMASESVYRAAMQMELGDAQALCILATDLPTVPVLAALEQDLGLPVVSSNQALFWAALGLLGLSSRELRCGRLFQQAYMEAT